MNTRRKMLKPQPDRPSVQWHLMKESYHPIFRAEYHEHIEYWYNMGATGPQRNHFRDLCQRIYQQDPKKPDPTFSSKHTTYVQLENAKILVKNYGVTLTDEGREKARVWLLHEATPAQVQQFRTAFTGCQTIFDLRSVMHTDYLEPEEANYPVDRPHHHRSVRWESQNAKEEIQALHKTRQSLGAPSTNAALPPAPASTTRVTKPKSQFDGVNALSSLGYGDMPPEEALALLRARQKAHREEATYYIGPDGETVYCAGKTGPGAEVPMKADRSSGDWMSAVSSDPPAQWKIKTLQ